MEDCVLQLWGALANPVRKAGRSLHRMLNMCSNFTIWPFDNSKKCTQAVAINIFRHYLRPSSVCSDVCVSQMLIPNKGLQSTFWSGLSSSLNLILVWIDKSKNKDEKKKNQYLYTMMRFCSMKNSVRFWRTIDWLHWTESRSPRAWLWARDAYLLALASPSNAWSKYKIVVRLLDYSTDGSTFQ